MKLNKLKRTLAAFLSFVLILTLTSITPLAAQGTLGTEQPHLSCTFTDSQGRAVDGNALSAGDYTVSFTLSGMQSFAVMQYTMSYDAAVLTVNGHSDLLSDSLPDQLRGLGAAGVLVQNGTINFGFITRVDQTATTTAIDAAGQLLLKLQVTVTTEAPVDFAKIVTLDTDPNQTFLEADYADYADYGTADQDCYALVTAFDGYTATLYPMTADLSPATGHAVTGRVLALANTNGDLAGDTFTVRNCDVVIADEVVATTNNDGCFTIPSLPAGEYTATLRYAYGYDRTVTFTVADSDLNLGDLGMIVCNFDKDAYINSADYAVYYASSGSQSGEADYNKFCDFNHDGYVNASDYALYSAFSGCDLSSFSYENN